MFTLKDRASWWTEPVALKAFTFNTTPSCEDDQSDYNSDDETTWINSETTVSRKDNNLISARCRDAIHQDLVLAARWALLNDATFTRDFNKFCEQERLPLRFKDTVSVTAISFIT